MPIVLDPDAAAIYKAFQDAGRPAYETLTPPEARDYLPGVRAAFNDLRLATDRLLRKDDDKVLTVSTLASLAAKWLLPRLTDFQEQHPVIDVRITTSTSLVDFQRDNVDAAIRYGLRCCAATSRCAVLKTCETIRCCTPRTPTATTGGYG